MSVNILYQGEDKRFKVNFTEKDTGTAIDLTSTERITAILTDVAGKEINRYMVIQVGSTADSVGFADIDITDAANGEIKFNIEEAKTTTARLGMLRADFRLRQPDSNFSDSNRKEIGVSLDLAEIRQSFITNV